MIPPPSPSSAPIIPPAREVRKTSSRNKKTGRCSSGVPSFHPIIRYRYCSISAPLASRREEGRRWRLKPRLGATPPRPPARTPHPLLGVALALGGGEPAAHGCGGSRRPPVGAVSTAGLLPHKEGAWYVITRPPACIQPAQALSSPNRIVSPTYPHPPRNLMPGSWRAPRHKPNSSPRHSSCIRRHRPPHSLAPLPSSRKPNTATT